MPVINRDGRQTDRAASFSVRLHPSSSVTILSVVTPRNVIVETMSNARDLAPERRECP